MSTSTSTATRQWITLEEAADMCGVTTKTIRRRISDGKLPAYNMAGLHTIRLKRADVDAMFTRIPTVQA